MVNQELEAENFEYLSRVVGEKIFILMKVSTINDLEKSERPMIAESIKEALSCNEMSEGLLCSYVITSSK